MKKIMFIGFIIGVALTMALQIVFIHNEMKVTKTEFHVDAIMGTNARITWNDLTIIIPVDTNKVHTNQSLVYIVK